MFYGGESEGTTDGAIAPDVVLLFSDDVVFATDVAFVGAFIVFGTPHISDSVELTNGSLGSQILAFCSGVNDDDVMFT